MKKIIYTIIGIIILGMFSGCTSTTGNYYYKYEDVKDTIIRFHVIANSDDDDDQKLKLKVKDKVIESLYPYLNQSNSIEESRKIIIDKEDEIIKIANSVIKEEGYNYNISIKLERDNFPEKEYGSIVLPQGNYEAFKIIIGNGNGKNWWCVMFPPLCFVDVTKGQVEEDKTKNELDEEIAKDEDENGEEEIEIKSKLFEWIKDIFN